MGALTRENTAAQQKAYAECRRVAPLMLADYYPLTPYSRELNRWIAWQYDRPEQGDGLIQAFRRPQCAEEVVRYKLRGLDAKATYTVTNFDVAGSTEMAGRELLEQGLPLVLKDCPSAALIAYKKKP